MKKQLAVAVFLFLLFNSSHIYSAEFTITENDSPAQGSAAQPNLFAFSGKVFLTWLEGPANLQSLKISSWDGKSWTSPRIVAANVPFFANWADFPSVLMQSNNSLVVHWLQKSAVGSYTYDVKISTSKDEGKTWTKPQTPHRDGKKAEHGFVSLVDLWSGRFGTAWLDARNFKSENEDQHSNADEMALMFTEFDGTKFLAEESLDKRVCDCCQTAATKTKNGLIVAYRDRSEKEVRDISLVRSNAGSWTEPYSLNHDGWKIEGCPVNGPSLASEGDSVVAVWFTAAGDKPRVQAKFSKNAGTVFGAAIRIDDGNPAGRVHTVMLADGSAIISWLENTPTGADIRIRRIYPDGKRGVSQSVSPSSKSRSSGFSRMALSGRNILIAWTEPSEKTSRIKISRITGF